MVVVLNGLYGRNAVQKHKVCLGVLGDIVLCSDQRRAADHGVLGILAVERAKIGLVELDPIDPALLGEVCRFGCVEHLARHELLLLRERLVGQGDCLDAHVAAAAAVVDVGNFSGHRDLILFGFGLIRNPRYIAVRSGRCVPLSKGTGVLLLPVDGDAQRDFGRPRAGIDAQIARFRAGRDVKRHAAARPVDDLAFGVALRRVRIAEIGCGIPGDLRQRARQLDIGDAVVSVLLRAVFQGFVAEMDPSQRAFLLKVCLGR